MTSAHRFRSMSAPARRLASACGALLVFALLALGSIAAPAGAIVAEAEGVDAGVQPRNTDLFYGVAEPLDPLNHTEPAQFANAAGNAVVPASSIYVIYWDPTDHYHGDWQELIDRFVQGAGASSGSFASVFAVDSQYTDKANEHAFYRSTFKTAYTDTEPYPAPTCTDPQPLEGKSYPSGVPDQITCLTNQQLQAQLESFIAKHSLPKGMGSIFYLLTPPGVTVCLSEGGPTGHCSDYEYSSQGSYENSFCSYHSDINPDKAPNGDASTVLYAAIPWTAGGIGDGDLGGPDRTPAYDCQDGGYDPASEPIEQLEKKKEKTAKQEQEINEKTLEEQAKIREAEKLEGPHQEEPNQPTGVGPDGFPDTGLADLIINQISIEQQNTVTDPLLNGWQDPAGNEATDECRDFFASASPLGGSVTANENTAAGTLSNQTLGEGVYYLNDAFSLAALKLPYPAIPCIPGIELVPQFTAPNPVNAGEIVGFDGMESDISLDWGTQYSALGAPEPTYALYKWNFGDGSTEVTGYAPGTPPANPPTSICEGPWRAPCAASTFHSYQYGGTYQVTLTATDTGGNSASVTHPVTVVGPAPPSSGGSGGGSSGGSGPGGASAGSAPLTAAPGAGGHSAVVPGPVATAAAVSSSLKQVARSGLVVHYTVNEQVAGRFEVLLGAATAHSLGISGRVASDLPAGSPKSLVIGQALLVTTKGGHSSVRIKFSKRTAKHLRRVHKLKLTLRLIVRNASSKSPTFTTVISTVVLHR